MAFTYSIRDRLLFTLIKAISFEVSPIHLGAYIGVYLILEAIWDYGPCPSFDIVAHTVMYTK